MEYTRKQLREMERGKTESVAGRKKGAKKLLVVAVIATSFVGVFFLADVLGDFFKKREVNLGVETFAELGRDHIAVGSPRPDYNSNPPTSGPHYANPAEWGDYVVELPDEQAVHNLEHGGVWISYNCAKLPDEDGCGDLKSKLEALAKKFQKKIILTPRAANDRLISAAAWTKLMNLDEFDEAKLEEFYKRYKDKGPELIPD